MSAQSKTMAALQAKAHNVLFAIQGLIFAAAALHGDLQNILSQLPAWIPTITGIIHLIYHEKQVVNDAYNSGESASIWDTATQASTIIANPNSDKNAIIAAVTPLLQAAQVAITQPAK